MMKFVYRITAVLGLVASLFIVSSITFAQETGQNLNTIASEPASQSAVIEYNLAFPGILPDHPLYKLKTLRNKVFLALIANPQKKTDWLLRETDKGILAAAMLIDKQKYALAIQTAYKAEHNYTLITYEMKKMLIRPDDEYFLNLKLAALKHQEVLRSLLTRVPEEKQKDLRTIIEFSERNWDTLAKQQMKKRPEDFL